MSTRLAAFVSRIAWMVPGIASADFTSMLNRVSGKASSASASELKP